MSELGKGNMWKSMLSWIILILSSAAEAQFMWIKISFYVPVWHFKEEF